MNLKIILGLCLLAALGILTTQTKNVRIFASEPANRVFLTSKTYNGNLGGITGADSKCQETAQAENLGGTWKAWISDSKTPASSRLIHSNYKYVLLNGAVVANNWQDLTDGSIQNPITITERGDSPLYQSCVWTSTKTDGSNFEPVSNITLCSNYSESDSNYSVCGHNGSIDGQWTNWSTDMCNQYHPLYCIEQVNEPAPTLSPTPTPTPILKGSPCGTYGDVDRDGFVTTKDMDLIARYDAGLYLLTPIQLKRANVNADRAVNSVDAMMVGQYAKGIISTFPICSFKRF